ncbi:MAG: hypothetical protein R6V40_00840 [Candidatus Moraniibacteriota bacterium]
MSSLKRCSIGISIENKVQEKIFIWFLRQNTKESLPRVIIHSTDDLFKFFKMYKIIILDEYSLGDTLGEIKIKGENVLKQAEHVFCINGKNTGTSLFQLNKNKKRCSLEEEIQKAAENCPLH